MTASPRLDERSKQLRRVIVRVLQKARRGHVGAAYSAIEILRVLYDDVLRFNPQNPKWKDRDRCILSKGHGCLALYAVLADKGFFPESELDKFCAANGIRYYHFLQPNQYLPGSKPMSDAERQIAVSELSGYKPHVETCFPLLREAGAALKAEGEQFHDLTQMFVTTEEPLYSDAACHFNLRGSSLIAAQIAKAIAADFTQ